MPSSEFRFVLHWPAASGFVNGGFAWRPFDYGQFPAAVGMGPFINPNHAGGFLFLSTFGVFTGPRS